MIIVSFGIVAAIILVVIALGGYYVGIFLDWFTHWWWIIGIFSLIRCIVMGIKYDNEYIIPDIVKTAATYIILLGSSASLLAEFNSGSLFDYYLSLILYGGLALSVTLTGYLKCIGGRLEDEFLDYIFGMIILIVMAAFCVLLGYDEIVEYYTVMF